MITTPDCNKKNNKKQTNQRWAISITAGTPYPHLSSPHVFHSFVPRPIDRRLLTCPEPFLSFSLISFLSFLSFFFSPPYSPFISTHNIMAAPQVIVVGGGRKDPFPRILSFPANPLQSLASAPHTPSISTVVTSSFWISRLSSVVTLPRPLPVSTVLSLALKPISASRTASSSSTKIPSSPPVTRPVPT